MDVIKVKGKKYIIKDPTIQNWYKVMRFKDDLTEEELIIKMIQEITELTYDDIIDIDAEIMQNISSKVVDLFIKDSRAIFNDIEHNGIEYKLVDVYNISFGQFVDIDTFLGKPEEYRIKNLNELAAYLYCEKDKKYSDSDFQKRIKAFEDLPVKYIEGAVFFLTTLGKGLHQATQLYSQSKWRWRILKIMIVLMSTGGGIWQFLYYLIIRLKRFIQLLLYPLSFALTTLHSLWTLIKKKKKR